MMKYFPKHRAQEASVRGPGRAGWAYTLDARKANGNNDQIAGTSYMHDQPFFVIFDCGASHFFISTKYVKRSGLEEIALPSLMVVTIATNNSVETNWVCESCLITLNDRTFIIDWISIPFKRIHMVLGMDSLSSNLVYISCKENTIFIPVEAITPYEVISTLLEGIVCVIHYLFE